LLSDRWVARHLYCDRAGQLRHGIAEAFVKSFRRDYVEPMDRPDAVTVMQQLSATFEHYNDIHPHSALKMLSPRMFRRRTAQLSVTAGPEK